MSAELQPIPPARPHPAPDPARIAARVLPLRRALLHELRWRAPYLSRRRVAVAVFVAILAHVLLLLLIREGMQPRAVAEDRRDVIHVRLLEVPPTREPAPMQELPPLAVSAPVAGSARNAPAPARRERAVREVEAPAPSSAGVEAVVATPAAPSLYNADGSLRLVPAEPEQTRPLQPLEAGKLAAEEMLQRGHNIVRCKRTRFAGAYRPAESLGESAARRYGAYVGLYNPATAQKAAERAAAARDGCDWED